MSKISSRNYCIFLPSLTKFTPNLVHFLVICKASTYTWFYVTDIIICNNFTLDDIVLLNFISISFHLLIPTLLRLFRLKNIHAGQNVHHCLYIHVSVLPHGFASWYLAQSYDYCETEYFTLIHSNDMDMQVDISNHICYEFSSNG